MSNYITTPPPLFGLANRSYLRRQNAKEPKADYGIMLGLYGDPAHPLTPIPDAQGNLERWRELPPLDPWQYAPMEPSPDELRPGEPVHLGIMTNAGDDSPPTVFYGPWDLVAHRVCHDKEVYNAVRGGFFAHPWEACVLTHFLTADARKFALNTRSAFDPALAAEQIDLLWWFRFKLLNRHPEWQARFGSSHPPGRTWSTTMSN
jgi:hypothetical protein